MFAMDILRYVFPFVQLLTLTFAAEKINVTKEAFAITQKNCDIIKNDNTAPPVMFAAADLVTIGKTGPITKTYGDSNTKYEITMTPHCILKGNTDLKTVTVRNMGQGNCGPTNVEKNDLMPYLFFLRATSDPKVFDALNLGAKRITEPSMVWGPAFTMFCTVTNKKVCTGNMCAKACNFAPMPQGSCIPYEQNVIDEIKKEKAKMAKMTTKAPPPPPTTTIPATTTTRATPPPPTTTVPTTTPTTTTTTTTTAAPPKEYRKMPVKRRPVASSSGASTHSSPVLLVSFLLVLLSFR